MEIKAPNPLTVVKNFSQVQSDLNRLDASLTQWENTGNTYPNSSLNDSFDSIASRLDDTTLDLGDLHPENQQLLSALKRDTLHVAHDSGSVSAMAQQGTTFGSGWSSTLDQSIADVRTALDAATSQTPPTPQAPPNPLKLMKNLSDVQADLSRMSGNLSQWESAGNIYPNSSVAQDFGNMASALYDAREALRALHPDQQGLLQALKGDILHVAADGGQTDAMSQQGTTFGSGWNSTLNRPIADVRQVIDFLTQ